MQKRRDQALLEAFHLMDEEEQEFQLAAFQLSTEGRAPKRPVLTLVQGGILSSEGGMPNSHFG